MSEEKSIRERRKTRFADKTLGTNRVSEDPERMKEWVWLKEWKQTICLEKPSRRPRSFVMANPGSDFPRSWTSRFQVELEGCKPYARESGIFGFKA